MESLINIGLILTYLMVGFAALAAIGFGVKKMLNNNDNTKKTLYTIACLAIVLLLSYLIASNEILHSFEKYDITQSTSKKVGICAQFFRISIATSALASCPVVPL